MRPRSGKSTAAAQRVIFSDRTRNISPLSLIILALTGLENSCTLGVPELAQLKKSLAMLK